MSNASSSLFLCRTALQARICLRIIETEGIAKPDIFFFTQSDSDTERQYFARLAALGGKSQYLFIKNQRIDLMSHVLGYLRTDSQFTRRNAYGRIFLASINNLIFRAIIKFNPAARVATFDDGTSNIFPFSLYHRETDYGRSHLYSRLLGLGTLGTMKKRSEKHYSIYEGFTNICPPEKIVPLDIFPPSSDTENSGEAKSFFIGQPFRETLNPAQIARLKAFIESQNIDFYVMHPREAQPLADNIPLLDKQGELAEIAILRASTQGRPTIYSCFSTVIFNIPSKNARKHYLHFPEDDAASHERLELVRRADCSVLNM